MSFLPGYEMVKTKQAEGIYIPMFKVPVVHFMLKFKVGAFNEIDTNRGIADAMTAMFEEGCGHYDAFQYADEIEKYGSHIHFSSGYETINASLLCLKEHFAKTLELMLTALYQPRFDEAMFAVKKKRVINGVKRQIAQSEYLVYLAGLQGIYHEGNRLSVVPQGKLSDIEQRSLEKIKSFYEKYFLTAPVSFLACGDIQQSELVSQLEHIQHSGQSESQLIIPAAPIQDTRKTIIIEKNESPQSVITFAKVISSRFDGNHYARIIMNYIFGGNFNSRINTAIREKGGLSYGADSGLEYGLNHGMFAVNTTVEKEHTGKAVQLIYDELLQFVGSVTETEIEKAKSAFIARIPLRFETQQQMLSYFSSAMRLNMKSEQMGKDIEEVQKLTHEDITGEFLHQLNTEKMLLVICGEEREVLTNQLPHEFSGNLAFKSPDELA